MKHKTINKLIFFFVILFSLALSVVIYLSNINSVSFNSSLYERGFEKYDIRSEFNETVNLIYESEQLISYLRSGKGIIESNFFNEREKTHLAEVRELYKIVSLALNITIIFSFIIFAIIIFLFRRSCIYLDDESATAALKKILSSILVFTGIITNAAAVFFILLALAFSSVFIKFHLLFFETDTWILDPATDNLIRMFPEGFFFDMFLRIVLSGLLFGTIILAAGLITRVEWSKRVK
jgi:integral membrane protein (TIGR01906 family)